MSLSTRNGANKSAQTRMAGWIGIDLGGTKVHGILTDRTGNILLRRRTATPPEGGNDAVAGAIIAMVEILLYEAKGRSVEIAGIGIGAPGFILPDGVIEDASNLGIRNLPIGKQVETIFGIPTLVMHDVKAAVLGEATFGAGRGLENVAFLNLGTGVSVGLLLDGRVHGGAQGRSGEIGHVRVESPGEECTCGKRGCLETVISGPALERRAARALADAELQSAAGESQRSPLSIWASASPDRIPASAIAEAAAIGDPLALEVLRYTAEYVAEAIGALDKVLALDCAIIGGGLANLGAPWLEMIRAAAVEHLFDGDKAHLMIEMAQLGDDTGALGVVSALMQVDHRGDHTEEQRGDHG